MGKSNRTKLLSMWKLFFWEIEFSMFCNSIVCIVYIYCNKALVWKCAAEFYFLNIYGNIVSTAPNLFLSQLRSSYIHFVKLCLGFCENDFCSCLYWSFKHNQLLNNISRCFLLIQMIFVHIRNFSSTDEFFLKKCLIVFSIWWDDIFTFMFSVLEKILNVTLFSNFRKFYSNLYIIN